MRVAFVSIPRFACAVEEQRNPHLTGHPLIVGDAEQPRKVLDCSLAAARAGVREGMTIRNALGMCPEAAIVAPDSVLYRDHWESILAALDDISPEIEPLEPGCAYVNVRGLERLYRDERDLAVCMNDAVRAASGLRAVAGLAGGKFPALAAAVTAGDEDACIIPAGAEAAFLAPLDVALLPVGAETVFRLQLLGLTSIGSVAVLSVPELQSQFGFEGKRLWQLANGIDEERLRPRPRTETLSAGLSFDAPVAGIDVLVAVARQLLSRLPLRGRAAREMTLQGELVSGRGWERRLVFREAVSEDERLVFLLRSALTNFPPPNAVRSLALRVGGLAGETGKQLTLGERGRLQRQLEETIRQLKARYGYSPIYRCVDVESWSVIPEERQILVESDA